MVIENGRDLPKGTGKSQVGEADEGKGIDPLIMILT